MSNLYYFDMVLAKDPRPSSVLHLDEESYDPRLRETSMFLQSILLHRNFKVSAY